MTSPSPGRVARGWGAAVAAVGVATAGRVEQAADFAAGGTDGRPDPRVIRILGIRQVGQGVLVAVYPSRVRGDLGGVRRRVPRAEHGRAGSLLARYRRAALLSAGIAASSAGVGLLAARQP